MYKYIVHHKLMYVYIYIYIYIYINIHIKFTEVSHKTIQVLVIVFLCFRNKLKTSEILSKSWSNLRILKTELKVIYSVLHINKSKIQRVEGTIQIVFIQVWTFIFESVRIVEIILP